MTDTSKGPGTALRRARGAGFDAGRLTGPVHLVVSPYKTGSSSMSKALLDLGIGRREMPYRAQMLKPVGPAVRAFNAAAQAAPDPFRFLSDHGSTARGAFHDFVGGLAKFDVFADYPFGHDHLHVALRLALAPEARFVWINRDFDAWTSSVRHWEESHPETYPRHRLWTTDPEARTRALRKRWNTRYQEFRKLAEALPHRCLEVQLETLDEDLGPLLEFYGREAGDDMRFPKRNVSGG